MVSLTDAPDELGDGSHIINVILDIDDEDTRMVECPKVGHEIRLTMDDDDLASPADAPGILQVAISATMAGSESDYLPEVYKELYSDESLRNPLYAKFKNRQRDRNGS